MPENGLLTNERLKAITDNASDYSDWHVVNELLSHIAFLTSAPDEAEAEVDARYLDDLAAEYVKYKARWQALIKCAATIRRLQANAIAVGKERDEALAEIERLTRKPIVIFTGEP